MKQLTLDTMRAVVGSSLLKASIDSLCESHDGWTNCVAYAAYKYAYECVHAAVDDTDPMVQVSDTQYVRLSEISVLTIHESKPVMGENGEVVKSTHPSVDIYTDRTEKLYELTDNHKYGNFTPAKDIIANWPLRAKLRFPMVLSLFGVEL